MKKIGIITINYNNLSGLKNTIASVNKQNFKDYEYVVIDGCSDDGSSEYIKDNGNIIDKYLIENDKGIYDALNKGIELCDAEYILALNSGDELIDKDVLTKVVSEIDNLQNPVGVIFGKAVYKFKDEDFDWEWPIFDSVFNIDTWLEDFSPNHQTSFIHHKIYSKYKYNTHFKYFGDSDFWSRLKENRSSFYYIPIKISYFSLVGVSNFPKSFSNIKTKVFEGIILGYFYKKNFSISDVFYDIYKNLAKFIYYKLFGIENYYKKLRKKNINSQIKHDLSKKNQ